MEYPADKDTARERALEASRQASSDGLDRGAPNIEAPGAEEGHKIEAPGDRNPPEQPTPENSVPGGLPAKPPKAEEVRRWEDEGGGVPDVPPPTTVS
jgi:hypothetical protein